jgi:hypothetical protein
MLVWLLIWGGTVGAVSPAKADPQAPCRTAEIFATGNPDHFGHSGDEDLQLFEIQADVTIATNGVTVTGSTLLDGVFWSDERQQTTYERSREFHLCGVDGPTLLTVAEALRSQFDQEAVLTFDYLPEDAPAANAAIITVPAIDIARFRDAFVADSAAHHRLLGGSVTTTDHTLILVADKGDLGIARQLVGAAGGDWDTAAITYGNREFVN